MSAMLRIFLKDVKRFGIFSALIVAAAVFESWYPSLGLGPGSNFAVNMTDVVRVAALAVLMTFVVQDDPVASDRSDWLTRPIHASAVLGAKALFLIATVLLPFAATTYLACAHYGLRPATGAWVASTAALRFSVLAWVLALIAVMTPNRVRALLVTIAATFFYVLLIPYLPLFTNAGVAYNVQSAGWHSTLACVVLLGGLLGYFYETRRRRATAIAAVVALAGFLLSLQWLEYSFDGVRPVPGLSLTATDSHPFVGGAVGRPFPFSDALVVSLAVTQRSSPDHDYSVFPRSARFVSDAGVTLETRIASMDGSHSGNGATVGIGTPWADYGHWCRTLLHVDPPQRKSSRYTPVLRLGANAWQEWSGRTGTLETTFVVGDSSLGAQGSIPVEVGATAKIPGAYTTVRRLRYAEDGKVSIEFEVRLIHTREYGYPSALWALVNDQTDEVSLMEYSGGRNVYAQSYAIAEERRSWDFQHVWKPGSTVVSLGHLTKEWLAHARLHYAAIRENPVAETVLAVNHFEVPSLGGSL